MCAYQGVRDVRFSENFAYVLDGWPLTVQRNGKVPIPLPHFQPMFNFYTPGKYQNTPFMGIFHFFKTLQRVPNGAVSHI